MLRLKFVIPAILLCTQLAGCANDLILDFGKGDSVRLAGQGDNFDCDDPAYRNVPKIRTAELVFADGTVKHLCAPKDRRTKPETPGDISGRSHQGADPLEETGRSIR